MFKLPPLVASYSLVPLIIAYILYHYSSTPKSTPVIKISTGQLQGKIGYAHRSGKEFWQFLSIPYAEAPVGKLRFQPPVPLKQPWSGVKQAVIDLPTCLQYASIGLQAIYGVEDCLYLNVFVSSPNKGLTKPSRPVLVYVHGGGYACGTSSHFEPDFFMDQDDTIVVTFNYRLGPLGFLSLAESDNYNPDNLQLPRGNMGLKDQWLLLKWIRENITHFGGDPKRVTLFGESAGAAAIHLLMISPKSQALFQKAISISGTARNVWAHSKDTDYQRNISNRYVTIAGCPLNDKKLLLECLQNVDLTESLKHQYLIEDPTSENDMLRPIVEVVTNDDTLFGKGDFKNIGEGKAAKIPWMLGVHSGEGGVFTARLDGKPDRVNKLDTDWVRIISLMYYGENIDENPSSIMNKIRGLYFGNNSSFSSFDNEEFFSQLVKLCSDFLIYRGVHHAAMEHLLNDAPTYFFYYNFTATRAPGLYSFYRAAAPNDWIPPKLKLTLITMHDWIVERVLGVEKGPRRFGVTHSEILYQLWKFPGVAGYLFGGDEEFSDALVKSFVDFARNDEKLPLTFRGLEWPPLTKPIVSLSGDITSVKMEPLTAMLMDNSKSPKLILEPYPKKLEILDQVNKEIRVKV